MSKKIKLSKLIKSIETYFTSRGKVVIGSLLAVLIGFLGYQSFMGTVSPAGSTVMVTNLAETSGGSGVIIDSSPTESRILTNAHVCAVARAGGYIITSSQEKYLVDSYVTSPDHDVCMIKVRADLGASTELASSAPGLYDSATISGHPALLPNVLSKGHFAAKKVIHLLNDVKECTEADYEDPDLVMVCIFFGSVPTFKAYQSTVVTAMIMGGSSGSAVYNWRNQISGLVFAGQGKSLSFAFAVPYEHVAKFVANVDTYTATTFKPTYVLTLKELLRASFEEDEYSTSFRGIRAKCQDTTKATPDVIKDICTHLGVSTLWLKD